MSIGYIVASTIGTVLCTLGLSMCLFFLMSKKVDTSLPSNSMLLCFFGLGWLCFMMESIQELSLGSFLGMICFFVSFVIWAHQLNIGQAITSLFKRKNKE